MDPVLRELVNYTTITLSPINPACAYVTQMYHIYTYIVFNTHRYLLLMNIRRIINAPAVGEGLMILNIMSLYILYGRNVWWERSLANLANEHNLTTN